jgi:tRNA(Arg) A34 adenosine deaminase TadA
MQNVAQIKFMNEAVRLSLEAVENGTGGPFGCVIVKDGVIIGRGANQVTSSNDPTAHAEVVAIRDACHKLGNFQLTGCDVYTTCEPCPMCLGAIYWARPDKIYYVNTREQAALIGFDDNFIYTQLNLPLPDRTILFEQLVLPEAHTAFTKWAEKKNKVKY